MDNTVEKVSLIIGTAGHIDHGKTSLIKALTSIDTDRLKEEKRRGLTIDLGFAYIDFIDKGHVLRAAIVDVPGHERFIKNMLAGATGMGLVLFTVAADDGIMPQTIEHLDIIRLLGIRDVFFVITKCDLAQEQAIETVEEQIKNLINGTSLEGSPLHRVSVKSGLGLKALTSALGQKVLSKKHGFEGRGAGLKSPFRMPVDRSFTIKGFGTVVTGTVAGGAVRKQDFLISYPSGGQVKVRGIESMHLSVREVSAGERAAINISGLSRGEIKRGDCLMAPELAPFISMSPLVDCRFEFTGHVKSTGKSAGVIRDRALIKVHHHTGEALARIRFLDKKTVKAGERAVGRLFLKKTLPMMRGDRFILRDASLNTTVGGGSVLFSYPSKGLAPRFKDLAVCNEGGLCGALSMLFGRYRPGLDLKTLSLLLNVSEDKVKDLLIEEGVCKENAFYFNDKYLLGFEQAGLVKKAFKGLLAGYHEAHPLEVGLGAEDLASLYAGNRKEKRAEEMRPLYRLLAHELAESDGVEERGNRLCLKGHSPGISKAESAIKDRIKALLLTRGLGLTKKEEFTAFTTNTREIEAVIIFMKKQGELISLKHGSFIGSEALNSAREKCFAFIRSNGGITAGQCRDILTCGRKLAIMILEYFDSQGLTIRRDDVRTLR